MAIISDGLGYHHAGKGFQELRKRHFGLQIFVPAHFSDQGSEDLDTLELIDEAIKAGRHAWNYTCKLRVSYSLIQQDMAGHYVKANLERT